VYSLDRVEGFRLGGGEENGNRQRKRRENRKTGTKEEIRVAETTAGGVKCVFEKINQPGSSCFDRESKYLLLLFYFLFNLLASHIYGTTPLLYIIY
jgi:hypothetical protein